MTDLPHFPVAVSCYHLGKARIYNLSALGYAPLIVAEPMTGRSAISFCEPGGRPARTEHVEPADMISVIAAEFCYGRPGEELRRLILDHAPTQLTHAIAQELRRRAACTDTEIQALDDEGQRNLAQREALSAERDALDEFLNDLDDDLS